MFATATTTPAMATREAERGQRGLREASEEREHVVGQEALQCWSFESMTIEQFSHE